MVAIDGEGAVSEDVIERVGATTATGNAGRTLGFATCSADDIDAMRLIGVPLPADFDSKNARVPDI